MRALTNINWILIFLYAPLVSFSSAVFGHAFQTKDTFGHVVWVESGDASRLVSISLLGCIGLLATICALPTKKEKQGSTSQSLMVIGVSVGCSLIWQFKYFTPKELLELCVFCLCVLMARRTETDARTFNLLAKTSVALVASIVLYALIVPARSWSVCREDKCLAPGGLFTSYFPHENFLSMLLVSVIPMFFWIRSVKLRIVLIATVLTLIFITGSRMAIAVTVVLGLLLCFRKARYLSFTPVLALLGSLLAFLFGSGDFLTGRGAIYEVIRSAFAANWFLGPGQNAVDFAFYSSHQLLFLPANEQGEAPHLLARYGVFGFGATLYFLYLQHKVISSSYGLNDLDWFKRFGPAVLLSAFFVTETPLMFSFASPYCWVFLIFISSQFRETANYSPTP